MNKIKFALVSLALVLGFTACNKNDYEYEPGKATTNDKELFFEDEEDLVLAADQNTVAITLNRANTEGELTVPLIVNSAPEFVKIPATATFAAGEAQTTVTIEVGEGMNPCTEYLIKISIPEEYTQAYKEDAGSPVYSFTIYKEDWEPVASGIFVSTVSPLKGQFEAPLEYSEFLEVYRFAPFFEDVYYFFHFDEFEVTEKTKEDTDTTYVKQEFYFTDAKGKHVTKFSTGYFHPSYGEVSVTILEDYDMGYSEYIDKNTGEPVMEFYWPWAVSVSAGSFGNGYQSYYVTEWLRKPWEEKNAE